MEGHVLPYDAKELRTKWAECCVVDVQMGDSTKWIGRERTKGGELDSWAVAWRTRKR